MPNLPYRPDGNHPQPAYHVIPDPVRGGWNVYGTIAPQEPQAHFDNRQEALLYVERRSVREGVGYVVVESESFSIGKPGYA